MNRKNNTYYGENIRKDVRYQTYQAYSSHTYETVLKVTNLQQIEGSVQYMQSICMQFIIFLLIVIIHTKHR